MKVGFDAKRIFHNTTGLGNYSRDLVSILSKFSPENEYVLYNPKPKKVTRLHLRDNMKEVLPEGMVWKKLSSLWRQRAVSKQIKRDGIALYHGLSGELPRGLENSTVKTVVTIHDLIFMRYPKLYSFFDRKIHYSKFLYAARTADRVIAISEQTKRDIMAFLKIPEEKITVIYQGCNEAFKQVRGEAEKTALRAKLNLPEAFVLNVGTIEERKNALSVVKAMKNQDIPLVIVGKKTDYYQQIAAYIGKEGMEDRVQFLEGLSLDELATLYQMATVFVYPSIFEGFGIPIIEALYSQTPVITSNSGVFPEAGGPHSAYVDPYDSEELAKMIKKLVASPADRAEMITKGREFVQKFDDAVIAKNLNRLYEEIKSPQSSN